MRSFLAVISLLCISFIVDGQLWTSYDSEVYAGPTTQIIINGDVSLNGNSVLAPDDGFVTGNWYNTGNADISGTSTTATIKLIGTNQVIGGTSASNFVNLRLMGTGTVQLNQDISFGGASQNGTITLATQHLILNSNTLTCRNPSAMAFGNPGVNVIVSETNTGGIYGRVNWEIAVPSFGFTNYNIPFGSSTYVRIPVTLNYTNVGSGTGMYSFATYPTDPWASPNNRPLPAGVPSLVDWWGFENGFNCVDRWWIIETSGYNGRYHIHLLTERTWWK
jgi:hypothetical protein